MTSAEACWRCSELVLESLTVMMLNVNAVNAVNAVDV
jgi:hypothetical protein